MNRRRVCRLDDTEVLAFLFGPTTPAASGVEGEQKLRAGHDGHVAPYFATLVEGELWTIRQWIQTVWAEQRCPASGLPLAECAESACREHRQREVPAAVTEAIRDLKRSKFLQGVKPHLHELGEAVIARLRRVCDILALAR